MKNRRKSKIYEQLMIVDAGAEGAAVAKAGDRVVFVPFGAPGDVVDIEVFKKKKHYFEGRIRKIHSHSDKRTEPACIHFGLCGGCKWQHLAYEWQLFYKQKQVKDNLERIAKVDFPELQPIIRSADQYYYRNKLEFTFSNRKWLTDGAPSETHAPGDMNGLGFHLPGMFDRILDIEQCHLQGNPSNAIRLFVKKLAMENKLSFYNVKTHEGLLRNLIIRTTRGGDVMAILVTGYEDDVVTQTVLPAMAKAFPEVTSLMYVVNEKKNDSISDLPVHLFSGKPYITETMPAPVAGDKAISFRIGPVSFYQTNPIQAEKLYKTAFDFAGFQGHERVYDLYTGTGTIANYIAAYVKEVIGIEYVEDAVKDARANAELNEIGNTRFFAGDLAKLLTADFVAETGQPEVIITDPPRSGMHPKVIDQLLDIQASRIVYVSCNPATQARDLALLEPAYEIKAVQPVDMFPQTQHVENVVLLQLR